MLEKAVLLPATKMRSTLTVGCRSMFIAWCVAVRIADISFKIISKLDVIISQFMSHYVMSKSLIGMYNP